MNTNKHTPGPWEACCKDTEAHYVFGPNCDETICRPCHNDPSEESYEPACGTITKGERLANARLIAAAPELLESLEMIRDADDDCKKDGLPRICPDIARAKIDSAIAKATGQEQ